MLYDLSLDRSEVNLVDINSYFACTIPQPNREF